FGARNCACGSSSSTGPELGGAFRRRPNNRRAGASPQTRRLNPAPKPVDVPMVTLTVPLRGLLHAVGTWRDPFDLMTLLLTTLCVAALLLLRPRSDTACIAGAYALLAIFLGPAIWAHWYSVSRLLLP